MSGIVDTHRDAHLRCADHINWCLVALENFKYLAQEARRQKHSRRLDFDGDDIVLGSDGLDLAVFSGVADGGSLGIGVHRVQQAYGDTSILRRLHTGGVQDLGTEVSQFGGFLEMQLMNGLRVIYYTRVVVVHTVDIGPDLNLLSTDSGTHKRSRIVGTAALKVVDLTIGVTTDESLGNKHLCTLILLEDGIQLFPDVHRIGLRVFVGAHEIQGIQQHGLDTNLLHVIHHHIGRHHLALCHDALLFETGEQFLGERAQIVELSLQEFTSGLLGFILGVEFLYVTQILLLQTVDYLIGAIWILLVEIIRNLYKRVGSARHGGEHDKDGFSRLGDELCHLFHSLRSADGSSAEFHYFHIAIFF